jgi:ethanolamine permease
MSRGATMKGWRELFFYVTVSCGMALATSVFTMISGLFKVTSGLGAALGVAVAGFFCLIIAMSIGELASMYPSAPAVRTYLKNAFGDAISLVLVYLYLISVVLVGGLESFIFAQVSLAVFPSANALLVIVVLFSSVMAVNLAGLELPRSMQMFTAVAAVAIILIAGAAGLLSPQVPLTATFAAMTPDLWLSVPAAAGMGVFLYMGFEWVTPLGLRPKSYQWHVPVSMAISVGVLIVAYEMFIVGAASQLSRAAIGSTDVPQVAYFSTLFGPAGLYLALALAVSATVSTFNAGIMGGSRLIYLLSREGFFPAWCSSLSLRTGAPTGAVVLLSTSALASGIAVLLWDAVLLVAVIGAAIICVLYAAFLLSALVLRKKRPDVPRPYRSRVWSPLQWLGVIGLPLLGLQTLLSEPSLGSRPIYGGAIAVAVAGGLAWFYAHAPRGTASGQAATSVTQSLS